MNRKMRYNNVALQPTFHTRYRKFGIDLKVSPCCGFLQECKVVSWLLSGIKWMVDLINAIFIERNVHFLIFISVLSASLKNFDSIENIWILWRLDLAENHSLSEKMINEQILYFRQIASIFYVTVRSLPPPAPNSFWICQSFNKSNIKGQSSIFILQVWTITSLC